MEFSRASRLRMLKLAATINWPECSPCLFVTLTYPDESDVMENYRLTYQRSYFWREMERFMRRPLSGLWRVEWVARKSGFNVGTHMPHIHILVLKTAYIPMDAVNETWARILKVPYVRTDIQACANEKQAGHYVAKYAAKCQSSSLVNAAYLNMLPPGRAWGIFRKSLVPT